MWTDSELEWLDKHRELIDSRNEKELSKVFPTDDSRVRLLTILTLFMDGEFKAMANHIRPEKKLFTLSIYTNLFKIGDFLRPIVRTEGVYKGKSMSEEDLEYNIAKILKAYGIPQKFIEEVLKKTTGGG